MRLPLSKVLKKQAHVEIAMLQDEVVDILYSLVPQAVLHGGTAIWRCYQANRFSEDLDFYAKTPKNFRERLSVELEKRQFFLPKFKQTQSTIFSKISRETIEVRLEIALRDCKKKTVVQYERANGSFMDIYSLSVEDLLAEKMNAFLNRRLVRDIYDVYFLSSKISDFSAIKAECEKFSKNAKMPLDEKNLKTIVYSGIAPASSHMLDAVLKRFKT